MRITAGFYKGHEIKTVKSNDVRPTLSKVRASIFNVLNGLLSIQDARMLDLFAGSGIMGFEAVSRGVKEVVFIDKNPKVAGLIKENIAKFNINAKLFQLDAFSYLKKTEGEKFDLIYLDPPYFDGLYEKVLGEIADKELLLSDGVLVLERDKSLTVDLSDKFEVIKTKTYGNVEIDFMQLSNC